MSERSVGYYCEECSRYSELALPREVAADPAHCEHCGHEATVRLSASMAEGGAIDRCPCCENLRFFLRKDFPQQLGCAAVSATIVLSSIAYAVWDFPAALAVLVVASIADMALYHRLSDVTVCYRCHAELRGFAENEAHGAFDMHVAEEYEAGQ